MKKLLSIIIFLFLAILISNLNAAVVYVSTQGDSSNPFSGDTSTAYPYITSAIDYCSGTIEADTIIMYSGSYDNTNNNIYIRDIKGNLNIYSYKSLYGVDDKGDSGDTYPVIILKESIESGALGVSKQVSADTIYINGLIFTYSYTGVGVQISIFEQDIALQFDTCFFYVRTDGIGDYWDIDGSFVNINQASNITTGKIIFNNSYIEFPYYGINISNVVELSLIQLNNCEVNSINPCEIYFLYNNGNVDSVKITNTKFLNKVHFEYFDPESEGDTYYVDGYLILNEKYINNFYFENNKINYPMYELLDIDKISSFAKVYNNVLQSYENAMYMVNEINSNKVDVEVDSNIIFYESSYQSQYIISNSNAPNFKMTAKFTNNKLYYKNYGYYDIWGGDDIRDNPPYAGYLFDATSSGFDSFVIQNNYIQDKDFWSDIMFFYKNFNCTTLIVQNNTLYDARIGILNGFANQTITIDSNYVENPTSSDTTILIKNITNSNVNITNNVFKNFQREAIHIEDSDSIYIAGNRFELEDNKGGEVPAGYYTLCFGIKNSDTIIFYNNTSKTTGNTNYNDKEWIDVFGSPSSNLVFDSNYFDVHNVWGVINFWADATVNNVRIENNYLKLHEGASDLFENDGEGQGIYWWDVSNGEIKNNIFEGDLAHINENNSGMIFDFGSNVVIEGNTFKNLTAGLVFGGVWNGADYGDSNIVIKNTFTGCDTALWLEYNENGNETITLNDINNCTTFIRIAAGNNSLLRVNYNNISDIGQYAVDSTGNGVDLRYNFYNKIVYNTDFPNAIKFEPYRFFEVDTGASDLIAPETSGIVKMDTPANTLYWDTILINEDGSSLDFSKFIVKYSTDIDTGFENWKTLYEGTDTKIEYSLPEDTYYFLIIPIDNDTNSSLSAPYFQGYAPELNQPPYLISALPDITDKEDTNKIYFYLNDYAADTDGDSIIWSGTTTGNVAGITIINGETLQITPIADANGQDTIYLYFTDNKDTESTQMSLTLLPVNDTPIITSVIPNQSDIEDTGSWEVILTDYESDTDGDTLNWEVAGGGSIVDVNIEGGDTLTITPIADANGSETITLLLGDGMDTTEQQVMITLTGVNDTPIITPIIPGQNDIEDTGSWSIALANYESDTDVGDTLSWSVSGGGSVVSVSIENGDTLTITPITDANGSETITLYLTDNSETVSQEVNITLSAVNDTPYILDIRDNYTDYEDTESWGQLLASANISDSDADTTFYWVVSGGGQVIEAEIKNFIGAKILQFTPIADKNGEDTVYLYLSDGIDTTRETINIVLSSVNDSPQIIGTIPNQIAEEDTGSWSLYIGSYGYTPDEGEALYWSIENTDNVVNAVLDTQTIIFTPKADKTGIDTLTIYLSDNIDTISQEITIEIYPENDPPVITAIPDLVLTSDSETQYIYLPDYASDTDNQSITYSANSQEGIINININNDTLEITPINTKTGEDTIILYASDSYETAGITINVYVQASEYNGNTYYVSADTGLTGSYANGSDTFPYSTITEALNKATDNDTVIVYNGVYNEGIEITKEISLIGSGTETIIISSDTAIEIKKDNVKIKNISIQNSGIGLILQSIKNTRIENTEIKNNNLGIRLLNTTDNIFLYNTIDNNNTQVSIINSADTIKYTNFINNKSKIAGGSNGSLKDNYFDTTDFNYLNNAIDSTILYEPFYLQGINLSDTILPSIPNFSLSSTTGKVDIIIDTNTDLDFKDFVIYKADTSNIGNWEEKVLTTISDTKYIDREGDSGSYSYYRVVAEDKNGNKSFYSEIKSIIYSGHQFTLDKIDEKYTKVNYYVFSGQWEEGLDFVKVNDSAQDTLYQDTQTYIYYWQKVEQLDEGYNTFVINAMEGGQATYGDTIVLIKDLSNPYIQSGLITNENGDTLQATDNKVKVAGINIYDSYGIDRVLYKVNQYRGDTLVKSDNYTDTEGAASHIFEGFEFETTDKIIAGIIVYDNANNTYGIEVEALVGIDTYPSAPQITNLPAITNKENISIYGEKEAIIEQVKVNNLTATNLNDTQWVINLQLDKDKINSIEIYGKVGYIETVKSDTQILADNTPPDISSALSNNNWDSNNIIISFAATEDSTNVDIYYSDDAQTYNKLTGDTLEVSNEGENIIYYYAIDEAGNKSSIKTTKAKVDKTINIPQVIPYSSQTNKTTISFSINVQDTYSGIDRYFIQIRENGSDIIGETNIAAGYIITDSGVKDSQYYEARAYVIDKAGNKSNYSNWSDSVVVNTSLGDTLPPSEAIITNLPSQITDISYTFTGTKDSEAVQVLINSIKAEITDTDKWQAKVYFNLEKDTETIIISSIDEWGNSSETEAGVYVDNIKPSAVELEKESILTNSTNIIINGSREKGSEIEITKTGADINYISDTLFQITFTQGEGKQEYSINAVKYGVKRSDTKTIEVAVDLTAPSQPNIIYTALTKEGSQLLRGSFIDTDIDKIYINNDSSVFLKDDNTFQYTVDLETEGNNSIKIVMKDNAGNWSDTKEIIIIKDTTPPEKPTIESPENGITNYSGIAQISGAYTDTSTYNIYINEQLSSIDKVNKTFVKAINLTSGINYINVIAVDSLGNRSDTAMIVITFVADAFVISSDILDNSNYITEPDSIIISFSKEIDTTTLSGNFEVKINDEIKQAVYNYQTQKLDISGIEGLAPHTELEIRFKSGIKALSDSTTLQNDRYWKVKILADTTEASVCYSGDSDINVIFPANSVKEKYFAKVAKIEPTNSKVIEADRKISEEKFELSNLPITINRRVEITAENLSERGITQFDTDLIIKIYYPDNNQDGIVDNTNIKETGLCAYYLDEANNEWVKIDTSAVNTTGNYIEARVNHLTVFTILGGVFGSSEVAVYPNPATSDNITLAINLTQNSEVKAEVYSMFGRRLKTYTLSGVAGVNKFTLNISDITNGMYMVVVKAGIEQIKTGLGVAK